MTRKKILFLIPTFFQGGAERVISELSQHFPPNTELVLVIFENKISFPFQGRVISLNVPLSRNLHLRIWRFFMRLLKFKKVLAQEKPDAVVSAGASANAISILVHPQAIVRVDMHISESRKGLRQLPFKLIVRFLFKKAGMLIPVSKTIAHDLQSTFHIPAEKMRVIYNPVDVEKIRALSKEPLPPDFAPLFEHLVVITMGRLEKQKGHKHLLKAFALVKQKNPQAKLVILGEGFLKSSLQELSRELDIQDSVHFLGWQDNPFRFLSRAKVFVLSSLWEGLPDVLLEALAVGLPIVSTDCRSGPREILSPSSFITHQISAIEKAEHGYLVPVAHEELLAEAMSDILQDPAQQAAWAEKARQRARDFDIQRIIGQWDFL